MNIEEGQILWSPSAAEIEATELAHFSKWLREKRGAEATDYPGLWRWSVENPEGFWQAIWEYFEVQYDGHYARVLNARVMPGAKWFEGARVNYAEHLLRHENAATGSRVAIHHVSELRALSTLTWRELGDQVRRVATRLRALGVKPGDRVVAYMPNISETAVAMLATTAIGAVWSSASPEFGAKTVLDRFAQIEPTVMFTVDGYRFGGEDFERMAEAREIIAGLPTLKAIVWVPYLAPQGPPPLPRIAVDWQAMVEKPASSMGEFRFERVGHDHPLWILFSSGTTGLPKAILHGHTGILLEQLKGMYLQLDLGDESTLFCYTTTGWMVWNALISGLIAGAAIVLYDGHPAAPAPDILWQLASETRTSVFGTSPAFVQAMERADISPGKKYDLSALDTVILTGSPSGPEVFGWIYGAVKQQIKVHSASGGTELCAGIVGGVPTLPVRAGEIQTRLLGMDAHVWSEDGKELVNEVGELVITTPAPSMPLGFWNDAGGKRYRETYFDMFPGVWRHGDFMKINERGACQIYGRSDATLNRQGVRIGTAEVYLALQRVEGVSDGLIVCYELADGRQEMPLFVKLEPGVSLDEDMQSRIVSTLRRDCSPRHVPDRIVQVPDIPYTLMGKKMEVPVRKLLQGLPSERVFSRDAMRNPDSIAAYVEYASSTLPS